MRLMIAYRKTESSPCELRVLTPSEIRTARDGAKLLVGFDHDRNAPRTFRIDRIVGEPVVAP